MPLPRPTFRVKLLTALLGSVAVLVTVGLAVVGQETERQVEVFVATSIDRSRTAFFRLETSYELALAELDSALVVFTTLEGEPVAAVVNSHALADPATAVPGALLGGMVARGDTVGFGYHVLEGRIYAVHATLMRVVQEPIGFLTLGTPMDSTAAASLGQALAGEVCFVAGGRCVAGTVAAGDPLDASVLAEAAGSGLQRATAPDGSHWTLVADALPPAREAWRVLAVPLDAIVAPFDRIRDAIRLAALAAILLAALLAILISRGLAQPVRALVRATGQLAGGDYGARVAVRSRDELGDLAASFNDMAEGLMLKERYRGLLDKVVSPDVAAEMLKGEIVLGGENREVTTLFADVRGFTPLTEGMEPQAVIAMLNEIMERASSAVEAEGGVVDKYVGDEVMAVFGAPMSRPDDATRALRAALRIRAEIAALSRRREARGEQRVAMGIGVNTGVAVAGNMGSERRLNYTVLGECVNIAARLCSVAGPGEILASETTIQRADGVRVRALPDRVLKGVSRPVRVFAVEGQAVAAVRNAVGLVLLALWPGTLAGQVQPPPELRLRSNDGRFEAALSGTLEMHGYAARDRPAGLLAERDPFVAPRATLFLDLFAGDAVYALVQPRFDRGETPASGALEARLDQAYIRVAPSQRLPLTLQVGKFATPFGAFAARHNGPSDPLIRPPLMHDHRTMVCAVLLPGSNDGFIDWKDDPERFRPFGAPAVWQVPYPTGALATATPGRWEVRLAVVNSAPSSAPAEWAPWRAGAPGPSYVAHVGFRPSPAWQFGVSWNRGPYLAPGATTREGYGSDVYDFGSYDQELVSVQAAWSRGWVELRAEALLDRWEVPNTVDDPTEVGWYTEAKVKVRPGAWLAARVGAMHFLEVHRSDGTLDDWDYDVGRVQLGGGIRLGPGLELRAEGLLDRGAGLPEDVGGELFSVQLAWLR